MLEELPEDVLLRHGPVQDWIERSQEKFPSFSPFHGRHFSPLKEQGQGKIRNCNTYIVNNNTI